MFDKLKEAVSDLFDGKDGVEKAVDQATESVDAAKEAAGQTLADVTEGGASVDSLREKATDLGGLAESLTGDASSVGAIADQFGGLADLTQYIQGIDFPIDKDQLITQLKENGAIDKVIELVQGIAQDRFGNQAELLDSVKGFLGK